MSLRRRLSSLRYRIAITVFLLESVMVLLVLWQALSFSSQQIEKQIEAGERAITELLVSLSRVALLNVEFDELQGYFLKAQRDPEIISILLTNDQAITVTARNRGMLVAAIGMLIILAVGLFIGYWLTRRLVLLTEAASNLEAGVRGAHTNFSGDDEIASLGRAFEHMRETIEHNIQELESRSTELSRYSEELESFSYSLVHDLRTPVRAITSFSQILKDETQNVLSSEQQDFLRRIADAGKRMAQLIDDMSEVGRVARQSLQYSQLDLSEMAGRIIETLHTKSPLREIDVDVQAGLAARGDRYLMHKALEEILDNAWIYTAERECTVIRVGSDEQDGETVFYIKDNGLGFRMEYVDKLFEPFQRLHLDERYTGSGIGLVMASRIIRRHGGRLWAESEEGKGASFFFTLPAL